LNFGKEPFFFNYELFMQHELSLLFKSIESAPVSRHDILKLVQEYMHHYGYSKTYETVTRKFNLPSVGEVSTPKSSKAQEAVQEEKKVYHDVNVNSFRTPKLTFTRSGSSKVSKKSQDDTSVGSQDKTQFAQRSLIRSLIAEGKPQEAERVMCLSFPSVAINNDVRTVMKVQRFLCLMKQDSLQAALFAKGHFTNECKTQPFWFVSNDGSIQSAQIKELMALFAVKPTGRFERLLDKCQTEFAGDLVNTLILSNLYLTKKVLVYELRATSKGLYVT
jgi:hypothetical protein